MSKADMLPILDRAAAEFGVDPAFLRAIARQETNFNPTLTSPVGARGLVQIMPATWGEIAPRVPGVDLSAPYSPVDSARVGAFYIARSIVPYLKSHGIAANVENVAAAYNGGMGMVTKTGGNSARWPKETRTYSTRVSGFYSSFKFGHSSTWAVLVGVAVVALIVARFVFPRYLS